MRSIAFHPESDPPVEALALFDDVVLVPERAAAAQVTALRKQGTSVLAAIQAGSEAGAPLIRQLQAAGWAGFVIDACRETPDRSRALFEEVRAQAPSARLLWRCPLERPPPRLREVDTVVVEDVFTDVDAAGARQLLPDGSRRQRLASLKAGFLDKGVAVVALERLRASQRPAARELARELARAGVVPWVSTGAHGLGVGLIEPQPRRILGLYDSTTQPFLPFTTLHRMVALPLEYFGYVLEYRDARKGLPGGDLAGRYAGVVSWFAGPLARSLEYADWLERQIDSGVRVAIFGSLGAAARPSLLHRLGLASDRRPLVPPVTIVGKDDLIGPESEPLPLARGLPPWSMRGAGDGTTRHLEVRDARGRALNPVVTGAWGGFAFDPYVLARGPRGSYRWLIDPFAFLQRALGLLPMPVPDVTTESGRRILMVQIDGDSFHGRSTLPQRPFAGEVILRDFLQVFRLPTTVSFVEGEIGPEGLNPGLTAELEAIAREIAALPHVELASHTYSHPVRLAARLGRPAGRARAGPGQHRPGAPGHPGLPVFAPAGGARLGRLREPAHRHRGQEGQGHALERQRPARRARRCGRRRCSGWPTSTGSTATSRSTPRR